MITGQFQHLNFLTSSEADARSVVSMEDIELLTELKAMNAWTMIYADIFYTSYCSYSRRSKT
jgi:hypothetical protein